MKRVTNRTAKVTKSRDRTASDQTDAAIYVVRIVLIGSRPDIWRVLQVPGSASLGWLHAAIQVAMGWTNSHLHHFLTPNGRYCEPRDSEDLFPGEELDRDENKSTLQQIAPEAGAQFAYEYDFGDSWTHEITVKEVLPPDPSAPLALCLEGARACPPEDCGGMPGYENLLKILKNRTHPEHRDMKEWLGRPFDAEAFDPAQINLWLRKLKWPRVTEAQLRSVLMARDRRLWEAA